MEQSLQHLTIRALTQYLKRKFEVDPHLQKVTVVGEVSNFRQRANSHQYFSLKDEHARISAVMYRSAFDKVPFKLEEGMKVVATGRVTLYEPSGAYQLVLEKIEPDGIGSLYMALEQLKKRFKEQGLLDLPKKSLPIFPRKIAVITSPSGAVIRDILITVKRRYPIVQVTVFPTRVQGKEAVGEIVAAFEQVNQVATAYDTVIVARGGGSIEDLWCFNDEAVAHAIIQCPLPVIAAIGHETDTTLADLVADMRAPTPTAAAELAVPVLSEVFATLTHYQSRMHRAMGQRLMESRKYYERLKQSYVLQQPERLYQAYLQQLDHANRRLSSAMRQCVANTQQSTQHLNQRLMANIPTHRIVQHQQRVQQLSHQLHIAWQHYTHKQQTTLQHYTHLLDAYSPLKIMSRGYAIVQRDDTTISNVQQVDIGQDVQIRLHIGQLTATITDIHTSKE